MSFIRPEQVEWVGLTLLMVVGCGDALQLCQNHENVPSAYCVIAVAVLFLLA